MNYLIDTVHDSFPNKVIQVTEQASLGECHNRLKVHDLGGPVSTRSTCDIDGVRTAAEPCSKLKRRSHVKTCRACSWLTMNSNCRRCKRCSADHKSTTKKALTFPFLRTPMTGPCFARASPYASRGLENISSGYVAVS